MRFPRKNVDTWPPTPPKKWLERTFFKLAHFCFFLQFKLCSKFLWISKIRLYSNLCRWRALKIDRRQKSGISEIYLHCSPNFWPPSPIFEVFEFWKISICINSRTMEFSISAEISNKAWIEEKSKHVRAWKNTLHSLLWVEVGDQVSTFFRGNRIF